jgi:hypothetical protein
MDLENIQEHSKEYWKLSPRNKDRWDDLHKPKVMVCHKNFPGQIGLLKRVIVRDGIIYWCIYSLNRFSSGSGWAGRFLPGECQII